MKRQVESTQRNVKFSFCPHPVTLDKSVEWGDGNVQEFPNGVFFKHDDNDIITHGVQPNEFKTAPEGWIGDSVGYKKLPIWVGEKLPIGSSIKLTTLDGVIDYQVKESSYVVYNGLEVANENDSWVQSEAELIKNYIL